MSMRTIARSSSNRKSASALASSVLPTPVGPRNRNEPVGRSGSDDAGPGAAHGVGDRLHGLALADRAACRARPPSAAAWPVSPSSSRPGRDAGPGGDHVGDVVGADLLLDHRASPRPRLGLGRRPRRAPSPAPGSRRTAAATRSSRSPSRCARSACAAQVVELLLQLADPVEAGLLLLPAGGQRVQLLLPVGQVARAAARAAPCEAASVSLRERQLLHLQPVDGALQLVDLDRPGVDLHPQPGRGLVDQVDRLVRAGTGR